MIEACEYIASLIAADAGLTVGTEVFMERMPDDPDRAVAVVTYSGMPPEYVHNDPAIAYERPRVQVSARAASAPDAYTLALNAYRACGRVHNDGRWLAVTPLSMPFLLKRDESERTVYAFNIDAMKGVN